MKRNRINSQDIAQYIEQFKKELEKTRTASSPNVSINIPLTISNHEKARLVITQVAYEKMCALVNACDKEIAWHGTVTKKVQNKGKKNETATYTIHDVFMFPQKVTSTTVQGVEQDYALWTAGLTDDVLNSMRLHGHSHVNMGVTPSGVDTAYQDDMLETLEDFYVFMILNKRKEYWVRIVDIEDNITYDTADINMLTGSVNINEWAAEQIKTHLTQAPPPQTTYRAPQATPKYNYRATTYGATTSYQQLALAQIDQRKQEEKEEAEHRVPWYERGYM